MSAEQLVLDALRDHGAGTLADITESSGLRDQALVGSLLTMLKVRGAVTVKHQMSGPSVWTVAA